MKQQFVESRNAILVWLLFLSYYKIIAYNIVPMCKSISLLPIILCLFVICPSSWANGQDGFAPTYLDARQLAMEKDIPYLIFFEKKECGPCAAFMEEILQNDGIKKQLQDNYIAVRVDIDDFDGYGLKKYYGINHLPSIMIFEPSGKVISKTDQRLGMNQLQQLLQDPQMKWESNASSNLTEDQPKSDEVTSASAEIFSIQCGGFSTKENAEDLKIRLNRIGNQDAFIQKDGKLYKVFSGKFNTKEKAELSLQLLSDYGYKGFIKVLTDTVQL